MFLKYGSRRINMSLVKEYKPTEKTSFDKKYYKIEFTFLDGSKDEFHFFENEKERNDWLKQLDSMILDNS